MSVPVEKSQTMTKISFANPNYYVRFCEILCLRFVSRWIVAYPNSIKIKEIQGEGLFAFSLGRSHGYAVEQNHSVARAGGATSLTSYPGISPWPCYSHPTCLILHYNPPPPPPPSQSQAFMWQDPISFRYKVFTYMYSKFLRRVHDILQALGLPTKDFASHSFWWWGGGGGGCLLCISCWVAC